MTAQQANRLLQSALRARPRSAGRGVCRRHRPASFKRAATRRPASSSKVGPFSLWRIGPKSASAPSLLITFETMRIPVLKGRSFTEQDRENTPRAIIVNEALARRYWPDEEVIGKRLGFE